MIKLQDVRQGLQTFYVEPRPGETPTQTVDRIVQVAARHYCRETGLTDDEIFGVRFNPYRMSDGRLQIDVAVGPMLARIGKGLAGATFVDGIQPDALRVVPSVTRARDAKRKTRNVRKAQRRETRQRV